MTKTRCSLLGSGSFMKYLNTLAKFFPQVSKIRSISSSMTIKFFEAVSKWWSNSKKCRSPSFSPIDMTVSDHHEVKLIKITRFHEVCCLEEFIRDATFFYIMNRAVINNWTHRIDVLSSCLPANLQAKVVLPDPGAPVIRKPTGLCIFDSRASSNASTNSWTASLNTKSSWFSFNLTLEPLK